MHGCLGGLKIIWNPRYVSLQDFSPMVGIIFVANFKGFFGDVVLVNCYGPYQDHKIFWNKISCSGLLNTPNVIFVGDLNVMVSTLEILVLSTQIDPFSNFISHIILEANLFDM